MKIKTQIKAGGVDFQHNETLAPDRAKGLKVKTNVKAGTSGGAQATYLKYELKNVMVTS